MRFRPRDDAFQVRLAGPWIAAALSDGVGACLWSRLGAAVCCEALCRSLIERAPSGIEYEDPDLMRELLRRAKAASVAPDFGGTGSARQASCTSSGTLGWYWHPVGEVLAAEEESRRRDRDDDEGRVTETPSKPAEIMIEAFREASLSLVRFANSNSLKLSDLSCTLMGVLVNTDTGAVDAGHVGDGGITVQESEGYRFLPQPPSSEEPGVPYMMSQPDWEDHLAVGADPGTDVKSIYLMSDGVLSDCSQPPCSSLFAPFGGGPDAEFWKYPDDEQAARSLIEWLANYERADSGDDRTLIAILR
jgi:hypothetical protein